MRGGHPSAKYSERTAQPIREESVAKKRGRRRKEVKKGSTNTASKSRAADVRVSIADRAARYRESLPDGMQTSVWAEHADLLAMARAVTDSITDCTHKFLALERSEPRFSESQPLRSQVYWIETLQYLHVGSAAGLMRHLRWVDGVLASMACPQYLPFAANVRGLLESAADIDYVLKQIPGILARNCAPIREAVWGEATLHLSVHVVDNLAKLAKNHVERGIMEHIIHFTFAGRLGDRDEAPEYHSAQRTAKYLTALQGADSGHIFDLYADLCEITHPGKDSLAAFVSYASDHLALRRNSELGLISDLCEKHRAAMTTSIEVGINECLLCLKMLNRFPILELHTTFLEGIDLSYIPEWRKLEPLLNAAG